MLKQLWNKLFPSNYFICDRGGRHPFGSGQCSKGVYHPTVQMRELHLPPEGMYEVQPGMYTDIVPREHITITIENIDEIFGDTTSVEYRERLKRLIQYRDKHSR